MRKFWILGLVLGFIFGTVYAQEKQETRYEKIVVKTEFGTLEIPLHFTIINQRTAIVEVITHNQPKVEFKAIPKSVGFRPTGLDNILEFYVYLLSASAEDGEVYFVNSQGEKARLGIGLLVVNEEYGYPSDSIKLISRLKTQQFCLIGACNERRPVAIKGVVRGGLEHMSGVYVLNINIHDVELVK